MRKPFVFALLFFCASIVIPSFGTQKVDNEYHGYVKESKENYFIFQVAFETYYIYEENTQVENGDRLFILGKEKELSFTSYEAKFSFEAYLAKKGVRKQLFIQSVKVKWRVPLRTKQIRNIFLSAYDEKTAGFLSFFLFGVSKSNTEWSSFAYETNAILYLSLSSVFFHAYYIVSVSFFRRFSKKKVASFLSLLLFLPFFLLSSLKFSVWKAILLQINQDFFKKPKSKTTVLFSLLIVFFIFNRGFFISDSFVFAFLVPLTFPSLTACVLQIPYRFRKEVRLCVISMSYMLLLFLKTGRFYLFSLPFLFFLSPFFIFFFFIGLFSFYTLPLPWLFSPIVGALEVAISYLSHPIFFLVFDGERYLYGVGLIVLFLALLYQLERGVFLSAKKILLIFPCFLILGSIGILHAPTDFVAFLNVGQGDATVIRSNGHVVMIDTGGQLSFDIAEEVLLPYLRTKNIHTINTLLLSHDDFDHAGAKTSLLQRIHIDQIIEGNAFTSFQIGTLIFENWNAFYVSNDKNNDSSVVYLAMLNRSFLFTGDIDSSVEKRIIHDYPNRKVDILKVAHHGAKSSTSVAFLQTYGFQEAIISCGKMNRYGHPASEVIQRLEKEKIRIRRTDKEGTITYEQWSVPNFFLLQLTFYFKRNENSI